MFAVGHHSHVQEEILSSHAIDNEFNGSKLFCSPLSCVSIKNINNKKGILSFKDGGLLFKVSLFKFIAYITP